ncbi:MAG: DUF3253 domain-containing protein [Nonlabens sp.]
MKAVETTLLSFALERGSHKTFCPSEVARRLFKDDWRDQMNCVRLIADSLVQQNHLQVLQKGVIQNTLPSKLKGPIRLQIKE